MEILISVSKPPQTTQKKVCKHRSITPTVLPSIMNIGHTSDQLNSLKEKIKRRVREFNDLAELAQQYWRNIVIKAKFVEKVIVEAESILNLFKITLTQVTKQFDSRTIKPLSRRDTLAAVLMIIIPELCSLPYSFIMKLNIQAIAFCDELLSKTTTQTRYRPFGIIEVKNCDNTNKTLDYFYSLIIDHFLLKEPGFIRDWSEFLAMIYPKKLQKKTCFSDITDTMKSLFSSGKKSFAIQDNEAALKAWKLRNKLNEFDPEGFRKPVTLRFEYNKKEVVPYGNVAKNLKIFSVNDETKLKVF